jgi:hypothetical protein
MPSPREPRLETDDTATNPRVTVALAEALCGVAAVEVVAIGETALPARSEPILARAPLAGDTPTVVENPPTPPLLPGTPLPVQPNGEAAATVHTADRDAPPIAVAKSVPVDRLGAGIATNPSPEEPITEVAAQGTTPARVDVPARAVEPPAVRIEPARPIVDLVGGADVPRSLHHASQTEPVERADVRVPREPSIPDALDTGSSEPRPARELPPTEPRIERAVSRPVGPEHRPPESAPALETVRQGGTEHRTDGELVVTTRPERRAMASRAYDVRDELETLRVDGPVRGRALPRDVEVEEAAPRLVDGSLALDERIAPPMRRPERPLRTGVEATYDGSEPTASPAGAEPTTRPAVERQPAAALASEPGHTVVPFRAGPRPTIVSNEAATAWRGAETAPIPSLSRGATQTVRLPHADLAEALVARARALPADGSLELRFALEPEDLGTVRVQILSRGEHLEVRILATSGAAIDAIGPGLSRLTNQLLDAGFRDPAIELSLEQHGAHAGGHDGRDAAANTPTHRRSERPSPVAEPFAAAERSRAAGRLDRMA